MLADFHALLENFVTARGLEWKEGPVPASANIVLEGYPLNVYYFEDRNLIMFQGIVALPPEEEGARAAFFIRLLAMNHGFSGTGGACLGFDPQEDAATFQTAWPLAGLTQERFDTLAENMIGLAARLMQTLAREADAVNAVGCEEAEAAVPDGSTGMIRI